LTCDAGHDESLLRELALGQNGVQGTRNSEKTAYDTLFRAVKENKRRIPGPLNTILSKSQFPACRVIESTLVQISADFFLSFREPFRHFSRFHGGALNGVSKVDFGDAELNKRFNDLLEGTIRSYSEWKEFPLAV
jgi:hypothetical protein